MDVIMEFATPIGMFDLDTGMCNDAAKEVKNIIDRNEEGVYKYKNFSVTTPDDLHQRQEFNTLVNAVQSKVDRFTEEVLGIDKDDLTLTCMWSNSHSSGSKHQFHLHPNSFLSGVLYVQCPPCEEIGRIAFYDPRVAKNMFYPDFKKSSCISNRTIWVEPKLGLLLLFPSWLEHGTDEFISDSTDPRIGISFNYKLNKATTKTMRV